VALFALLMEISTVVKKKPDGTGRLPPDMVCSRGHLLA
jgi:hypothetical protein